MYALSSLFRKATTIIQQFNNIYIWYMLQRRVYLYLNIFAMQITMRLQEITVLNMRSLSEGQMKMMDTITTTTTQIVWHACAVTHVTK